MQILLIGANGRVGSQILAEALSKNHTVTALLRNPSALTPHQGLTIVSGTPLEESDIILAIESSPAPIEVVITALNSPRKSGSPFSAPVGPPDIMEQSYKNLLPVLRTHGIRKIVTLSAFGVGASNSNVFFPIRQILNHSNVVIGHHDHEKVEELLKAEGAEVEWTIVKPAMLSEGERERVKTYGEVGKGIGWMPKAGMKSVAAFMMRCAEGGEGKGGRIVVIAE
jgi:putative NADH-flavin reductase